MKGQSICDRRDVLRVIIWYFLSFVKYFFAAFQKNIRKSFLNTSQDFQSQFGIKKSMFRTWCAKQAKFLTLIWNIEFSSSSKFVTNKFKLLWMDLHRKQIVYITLPLCLPDVTRNPQIAIRDNTKNVKNWKQNNHKEFN